MRGDLHCHTRFSDGSMAVGALIEYAAALGLEALAVTDHDTMAGVAAAQKIAEERGLTLIPGLEVSTFDARHGKKVHLLCYLPQNPSPLLELCARTLQARTEASRRILERLAAEFPITMETVRPYAGESAAVYKQHILLALCDRGYDVTILGPLFHELFSEKSGRARVEPWYPDTLETAGLIRSTGGLVVLAHPGVYDNFDLIPALCEQGLDGIEVFHPRQSEAQTRAAYEAARAHGLLMTGGSDFHGFYTKKPNLPGSRTAPEETLAELLGRRA